MKTIKLFVLGLFLIVAGNGQAQVSVSINLGSPPQWGPAGYSNARYYYLPDVEAYYDVQAAMFIYYGMGGWVHRAALPTRYKNYDLYNGYKVVMSDYHGNTPYTQFKEHKSKYSKGYHGQEQRSIGERPERPQSRTYMSERGRSYKKESKSRQQNEGRRNDNNGKKDNGRGEGKGNKK
jgi:hypothetical protein